MTIPEAVTAYVVTGAGKWTYDTKEYNYAYIEEVQGGVVPAYMPVIYMGEKANYTVTLLPGDNTPLVDNNLLYGTTIRQYLTKGTFLSSLSSTRSLNTSPLPRVKRTVNFSFSFPLSTTTNT